MLKGLVVMPCSVVLLVVREDTCPFCLCKRHGRPVRARDVLAYGLVANAVVGKASSMMFSAKGFQSSTSGRGSTNVTEFCES
jgi:hypothetical protein